MKYFTLKSVGVVTLFVAGLNVSGVGLVTSSAAQYPKQTQQPAPKPVPAPAPRPAPAPAPQPTPAPRPAPQRPTPAPQHNSQQTTQLPSNTVSQQRSSQNTTQRTTQSAPQSPKLQKQQVQVQKQQKQQAQEQKQAQKRVQQNQQDHAHQQKEQQKLQQKQQKEQARQQKETQKQQQKQQQQKAREVKQQQKEQARQQKEMGKLEKKQGKVPAVAAHSSVSEANSVRSDSASTASSRALSASNNHHAAYSVPTSGAVTSRTAAGATILNREGSHSVVQQLNGNRSSMKGINRKALPSGDVTVHANGSLTLNASGGRQYVVRSNGTIASFSANGKSASFDSKGKVSSIHTSNMDIRRGAHGERTILSHRADNTTVVATGRHSGYVERTVTQNNQTYIQRTVITNNGFFTNTYVAYGFSGVALNHYVSPVFYAPAFYGWAFYPWVSPIAYTWGWLGAPWYVGPNPYFMAYGAYPSASFWLTDYFLGQTLAAAYNERRDAIADNAYDIDDSDISADASFSDDAEDADKLRASVTTPITSEIKAAIAEEVKEQIEAENSAATHPEKAASYGELPSALGNTNHVFVVANSLDVTTVDQQSCRLQAGDILRLIVPPSDGSPLAQLRVASSKKMDCPAGVQVTVSLQDLQDMQNNLREQVVMGLGTLQKNQGKGGLPAAPPEALSAPPRPAMTSLQTTPSAEAVSMLETETHRADVIEADVTQSVLDGQDDRTN